MNRMKGKREHKKHRDWERVEPARKKLSMKMTQASN